MYNSGKKRKTQNLCDNLFLVNCFKKDTTYVFKKLEAQKLLVHDVKNRSCLSFEFFTKIFCVQKKHYLTNKK